MFVDPRNITQTTENISSVSGLLDDMGRSVKYAAMGYAFYLGDSQYKAGSNKGRNKFYRNTAKFVPLVNNLLVSVYTNFAANAAADILSLQCGNGTGDQAIITAPVAAGSRQCADPAGPARCLRSRPSRPCRRNRTLAR